MPRKRTLSLEHRRAISAGLRGHIHSEETRRKISEKKKGIPKSEEHKAKLRLALLGRKNPAHAERLKGRRQSQETKQKRSETLKRIGAGLWNRGRKQSEETKRKISIALKGRSLGRKFTEEHRKKLSERKILLLQDPTKHSQWRGGITTPERKIYLNLQRRALKLGAYGKHSQLEWENLKAVYGYRCLSCNRKEPEIRLTEDHIIPLTKGGTNSITNIQPLCQSCNSRKHTKTINYNSNLAAQ